MADRASRELNRSRQAEVDSAWLIMCFFGNFLDVIIQLIAAILSSL